MVRLAEAERGGYLLFRDAQFPIGRLDPGRLHALLARARDILDQVRAQSPELDAAAYLPLIEAAGPVIAELRRAGLYASDDLVYRVLSHLGEDPPL